MIKLKQIIIVFLVISLSACTSSTKKEEAVVLQTLSGEAKAADFNDGFIMEEVKESTVLAKQTSVVKAADATRTGVPWLISKVTDGAPKVQTSTYRITYDGLGNVLSKVVVPDSTTITEAEPAIYMYGAKPSVGAYFKPGFARYGADCGGCKPYADGTAGTASGVFVSTTAVRQSDGSWREGITYNGYYLFASSSSLPMCTILEVTDHKYSGMGLTPGKPFKALIVDRGVSGSLLDLFVGSEKNLSAVRLIGNQSPTATIVGFARLTKNSLGQRICK